MDLNLHKHIANASSRLGVSRTLMWLLAINSAVFVVGMVVSTVLKLLCVTSDVFYSMLALPAFVPEWLRCPWTLVTYMFFHNEIWHILFNLLWFWFFGRLFELRRNARQLRDLYILGGLAGGVLFMLFYNLFPYFSNSLQMARVLGASAAIMAITIAATLDAPHREAYLFGVFRIKVMWIAIFAVAIDVFSLTGNNAGGHIAHIGGALIGFLHIYFLKRGVDIGSWLDPIFSWFGRLNIAQVGRKPKGRQSGRSRW